MEGEAKGGGRWEGGRDGAMKRRTVKVKVKKRKVALVVSSAREE